MAAVQFFPFIALGVELVDFANLPCQAFPLPLQRILRLQGLRKRILRCTPGMPTLGQVTGRHLGIRVQQAAHRVRAGQALPGVLAVDVEQLLAHGAQLLGGGRAAVDPGAAFAL